MYFLKSELLKGLNQDFVKKFMSRGTEESHKRENFLFHEGKTASHFYILIKGCVKLSIGKTGHAVFTVDQPGEAFGWSSLVGRDVYSASAECKVPTKLLKIESEKLHRVLEKDPAIGLLFFRRRVVSLGDRLPQTYNMIPSISQTRAPSSFGTGQVLESEEITA